MDVKEHTVPTRLDTSTGRAAVRKANNTNSNPASCKSSIKPPGGLFISSPFEEALKGTIQPQNKFYLDERSM